MILSGVPFSTSPFSVPGGQSFAVQSPFSALINNQEAERAYLLRATPWHEGTETTVRFSSGLRHSSLANQYWPARMNSVVNTEVRLFSEDIGRGGSSSFGSIKLAIGDGDNDELTQMNWDGRSIEILMGSPDFPLDFFEPVFVGTAQGITWTESELTIVTRDKSELLDLEAQTDTYSGGGGLNGGADIAGQPKPLCYGQVFNIAPVLVDRVNLIYQFHDGSAQSVDGAFDGARALTFAGNVADITATSVSAGQYKTQLSGGYVKLGAEPEKVFTIDAKGDNTGGYVNTAGDIVQRVVTTRTQLSIEDINSQSIEDVNTSNSSPVGWFGASDKVSEIITRLMESVGGSYVFDRFGKLVLGVFRFTPSVGTIEQRDVVSIGRVRSPIASWRRSIGYAKSWVVQGQNDVLPTATNARKDFVRVQFRRAVDDDSTIKTRRLLSDVAEVDTLMAGQPGAEAEATRQLALFGTDRDVWEVTAKRQQFKFRAGQTVTLNFDRFGFPSDGVILSVVESTRDQQTRLRLFV